MQVRKGTSRPYILHTANLNSCLVLSNTVRYEILTARKVGRSTFHQSTTPSAPGLRVVSCPTGYRYVYRILPIRLSYLYRTGSTSTVVGPGGIDTGTGINRSFLLSASLRETWVWFGLQYATKAGLLWCCVSASRSYNTMFRVLGRGTGTGYHTICRMSFVRSSVPTCVTRFVAAIQLPTTPYEQVPNLYRYGYQVRVPRSPHSRTILISAGTF